MVIRAEKLSSLGVLTAGAAHEILNPANIIGLYAQRLLWENQEGSPQHETAKVIIRNVERISRICGDLRRYSRDEKPKFEPFNPDEVVRESIRPLQSELPLLNIKAELRLAESTHHVTGDRYQLLQVLLNLIRNAMDAMPNGGSLTIASTEMAEDGKPWWEVRVADTGTGIPKDILNKIFDPFFTTKASDKGTGLGLSVSYGIIENHGGKISVESVEGEGTTFVIRLPLSAEMNNPPSSRPAS
jgi:two-component system NtrC family sensor kinase